MGLIIGILNFFIVLTGLFLILVVLMQLPRKEAGLGVAFGGSATEALFGAGTGNVLTKATKYGMIIFLSLCMIQSLLYVYKANASKNVILEKLSQQTPQTTPAAAPSSTKPATTATSAVVTPMATNPATIAVTNPPAPAAGTNQTAPASPSTQPAEQKTTSSAASGATKSSQSTPPSPTTATGKTNAPAPTTSSKSGK